MGNALQPGRGIPGIQLPSFINKVPENPVEIVIFSLFLSINLFSSSSSERLKISHDDKRIQIIQQIFIPDLILSLLNDSM